MRHTIKVFKTILFMSFFIVNGNNAKGVTIKILNKYNFFIIKTIEYLKKGYKANEIAKLVGIYVNAVTKVKKVILIV